MSRNDLDQLIGDLSFALTKADRLLERAGEDDKEQRKAVLQALKGIEAFVAAALEHKGGLCIAQLRRRLENIGRHGGLEFKRPRGRPPYAGTITVWQATAASAMQARMGMKVKEAPAAAWVCRELAKFKIRVEPKQLLNWRDKFMRGDVASKGDWFDKMNDVGTDEDTPKERASNLIRYAVLMYPADERK